MMMWKSIIDVVLLFLQWWFKKQMNDAESMELFYKFVHTVNNNYLNSNVADQLWKKQAEELKKILDTKFKHPVG